MPQVPQFRIYCILFMLSLSHPQKVQACFRVYGLQSIISCLYRFQVVFRRFKHASRLKNQGLLYLVYVEFGLSSKNLITLEGLGFKICCVSFLQVLDCPFKVHGLLFVVFHSCRFFSALLEFRVIILGQSAISITCTLYSEQ